MTGLSPLPAHDRLAVVDAVRPTPLADLVHALHDRRIGPMLIRAGPGDTCPAPAWIAMDVEGGGILHIAPLLAGGTIPETKDPWGRPDAAVAATALGTIEPVVAAIETVVGRALRPACLVDAVSADDAMILIEAVEDGVAIHRILLALPRDLAVAPAGELPLDPAAQARIVPEWTATLHGPSMSPETIARMEQGDLILLGAADSAARFTPPGQSTNFAARLDLAGGVMVIEREIAMSHGPTDADAVAAEFDGTGLNAEGLAALAVGSVLTIPARGGVLPVRLVAGATVIARGDLVTIGDGYGVLIGTLARG